MRILHVIAGAPVGGAETFAQDAILSLHQRGVAQQVLTRPWPGLLETYQAAGIPAHAMRFGLADRLRRRGRRIAALARESGANLVHAWMSRANSFIPAAMPCPVLGWFGDYYNLKYFRRTDLYVGVTPDIASYLRRNGTPPKRTFMVNTFGTMPEAPPVDRASLATPTDALVLLVLSRLHQVKGIDTILRALADLPAMVLWLAGEGPARAEYETLARSLGVADRVRFLGWRNDRRALLEACDICVLPSRYEPFGTVIAEAWAMRRPLVATAADGARQYVTHDQTGLLCPIDDPPALATQLRRLAADPTLRARLAEGGAQAYEADFTREIITDRLLECYRACIVLGPRAR